MRSVRIVTASHPGEVEVAVADAQDSLLDYALWRPGEPDGVGDVHRGIVRARAPAMAGAFVAIAGADGFLPDSDGARGVSEGMALLVRVVRAAQGGKGPRLAVASDSAATESAAGGAGGPRLLARGPGPVERLAVRYPDAPVLADTPALAARLTAAGLGGQVAIAPGGLSPALREAAEALAMPSVPLPGGAVLHVWPTPALTALDLDIPAGAARGRGALEANRAALPALARQIRLRNLSGAILLDLAGMAQRKRAALGPALAAALAEDPVPARLLGFTALGLAEIVRTRLSPPLHELRAGPLAAALAALRAAEAAGSARLRVAPALAAALQDDGYALDDFAQRTGRVLAFRSDPTLAPSGWNLETT